MNFIKLYNAIRDTVIEMSLCFIVAVVSYFGVSLIYNWSKLGFVVLVTIFVLQIIEEYQGGKTKSNQSK